MLLVIDIQGNIAIFLWATLVMLVIFIAYKMLVKRMKQGQLEKDPAMGIVPIYFEMHTPMNVEISIFSTDNQVNKVIENKTFKRGGNIIQLDTREFQNGFYFYQAKSDNQKTRKRLEIRN